MGQSTYVRAWQLICSIAALPLACLNLSTWPLPVPHARLAMWKDRARQIPRIRSFRAFGLAAARSKTFQSQCGATRILASNLLFTSTNSNDDKNYVGQKQGWELPLGSDEFQGMTSNIASFSLEEDNWKGCSEATR